MSTIFQRCMLCGAPHQLQQHELSATNHGELCCPQCGEVLIEWHGNHFYTLGVPEPQCDPFALTVLECDIVA